MSTEEYDQRSESEREYREQHAARFKWDEERFNWDKIRFERDLKDNEDRKAGFFREQRSATVFRYLNTTLQALILLVLLVFPYIREHYYLEDSIREVVEHTVREEFANAGSLISGNITPPPPPPPPPNFEVGTFRIYGPPESKLTDLVSALFKAAADDGQQNLVDMLDAASKAVALGKDGWSLVVDIFDKGSDLIAKLWPPRKLDNDDRRPPVVVFDQVPFEHDTAKLSERAMASLDMVVTYLDEPSRKSERILIEGHASAIGSAEHNVALSRNRADRVRQYLLDHGVQPDRIMVQGFGSGYLWMPFFPDHPNNRRVRITTCGEGEDNNRCLAKR